VPPSWRHARPKRGLFVALLVGVFLHQQEIACPTAAQQQHGRSDDDDHLLLLGFSLASAAGASDTLFPSGDHPTAHRDGWQQMHVGDYWVNRSQ